MTDYYRRQPTELEPIELDVRMPDRATGQIHRVHLRARHLRYHEFMGLGDALIGEISATADPTGRQELKARRLKLRRVAIEMSNLDPEEWRDGRISGVELERWIDDDANADAVYAAWQVYASAIDSPPVKSATEDRRDGGGEIAGAAEAAAPAAHMSPV